MSEIIYHLKPSQPATGSRAGQPISVTRPEPGETCSPIEGTNARGQLSSPAVLLPTPIPAMKRLALDKGAAWCRILREARPYLALHSLDEVARIVGTSAPTLHRLVKKFGALPDAELTPERLAPIKDGGRECEWEFLLNQEPVRAKLLEIYVATMGASSARAANDRRTAKIATALRNFAYEPECPAPLRERLLAGYQPVPFVNFLRQAVTPEMEARVRGPKHYQLHGPSSVRDWTCRLPDGSRFEMPAAYTLSMDDMSTNHPFYVELPGCGQNEEEFILSRQGLYALWAKHKVWQSVELVARLRESYTAADILRTFYKMCLSLGGVPPFVEFEQAIWKANKISGWKRDGEWIIEEQIERPGMAKDQMNTISAGLGLCGVKVLYKTKAHQKHIETHFNALQNTLAIVARQYQCIGRYAGEFELPGKQLRRVRAGSHTPRDLHFASQAQLADCIAEAFRRTWEMPSTIPGKTRYEAHQDDLSRVGLLPLSPRLFAACLPGELRKTTIRNGYINVEYRGAAFQFRAEEFAHLGDGYELYYKFDDTDPNLGAAIFNRTSPNNSANFQGWQMDEFMFVAPREIPGPKLEVATAPAGVRVETIEDRYGVGAVDRGDTERRKQDKFVATAFRSMPRPGQPSVRSASARDGRGNVVEMTNTAALQNAGNAPAAALPPRPVSRRTPLDAPTPEEFASKRDRLAASAARARELAELATT